ncbi:MAG: hypothetical protein ACYSR1_07375, partial [Planctomycetota bacterium]
IELTDAEALKILETLDPAMEEDKLIDVLSPGQIAWRRVKLDEMDFDLKSFKQEYPMTLDECFQASGDSLFHKVMYQPTEDWEKRSGESWGLGDHPADGKTYVLGADPAGGVGKDNSVIEIICLDTMEQVFEWTSNRIDPETFASKIAEIGEKWGGLYCVVENNNHGILTLSVLDKIYPSYLIHMDPSTITSQEEKQLFHLGYRTTGRTKPLMIGRLRTLLARELMIHSPLLRAELSTFIEKEDGKMGAQDGCMDDTVMALACAAVGINNAAMYASKDTVQVEVEDPFDFETIIRELQGRAQGCPIRSNTEWRN